MHMPQPKADEVGPDRPLVDAQVGGGGGGGGGVGEKQGRRHKRLELHGGLGNCEDVSVRIRRT